MEKPWANESSGQQGQGERGPKPQGVGIAGIARRKAEVWVEQIGSRARDPYRSQLLARRNPSPLGVIVFLPKKADEAQAKDGNQSVGGDIHSGET